MEGAPATKARHKRRRHRLTVIPKDAGRYNELVEAGEEAEEHRRGGCGIHLGREARDGQRLERGADTGECRQGSHVAYQIVVHVHKAYGR